MKYKLPSWKLSGGHVTSSVDYFRYLCGHVTNAVSMFVTAQPTHLSSCKYFSMSYKIFSAGPAQAPVLHRRVLLPPGVLPARGPAARHPRARRPRLHLAVAVLGLGPPPHGGHPGHQAGQQTTAGRVYRNTLYCQLSDDGLSVTPRLSSLELRPVISILIITP